MPPRLSRLPATAAWRHVEARDGFEVRVLLGGGRRWRAGSGTHRRGRGRRGLRGPLRGRARCALAHAVGAGFRAVAARWRRRTGESAQAPAAYVRALDLTVEQLEQRYVRI